MQQNGTRICASCETSVPVREMCKCSTPQQMAVRIGELERALARLQLAYKSLEVPVAAQGDVIQQEKELKVRASTKSSKK